MIGCSRAQFLPRKAEFQERAEDLLERVGVIERKDFHPSQLSGGERQRAAIARALMNYPQIVFCDEPTGNLDTATGDRIHQLILELNERLQTSLALGSTPFMRHSVRRPT